MKTLAAVCLLLLYSSSGVDDDREQLLGVWKLQTFDVEFQDTGESKAIFGAHPNGFILFTSEGPMMAVLTAEERKVPKMWKIIC
jgi:hypothetical protein